MQDVLTAGNLTLGPLVVKNTAEAYVLLGSESNSVLDGTLLIQILNESGSYSTIKEITSIDSKDDKFSRFLLPPNTSVRAELVDGGSSDIFAQITSGVRLS